MPEKIERFIGALYKRWKAQRIKAQEAHPDEEELACFLENKLSDEECSVIKSHLIDCDRCAEIVATQLALRPIRTEDVPQELLSRTKDLVRPQEESAAALEITLRLRENVLDLLDTTADVLVGRELVSAPLLRGRKIREFRDQVSVFEDFKGIRIEVKIAAKQGDACSLALTAQGKVSKKAIKGLRFTRIKDETEEESYVSSSGQVTFEHVIPGKYRIEISTIKKKLACVLLDIRT